MVHMQADLFNGRPQLQLLMTVAALIGAMSRIEAPVPNQRPMAPVGMPSGAGPR
jgi:hypothetical protein